MHHQSQGPNLRISLHQQHRGSRKPSHSPEYFPAKAELRIGAVLSCAKGYELRHSKTVLPNYKYIPTIDHEQCDISVHFDEAVNFISSHLRTTNVLVHCIAGVSRSVSMVIAYFIREHRMDYDQAYSLVKAKRKIVPPILSRSIRMRASYSSSRTTVTPSILHIPRGSARTRNSIGPTTPGPLPNCTIMKEILALRRRKKTKI